MKEGIYMAFTKKEDEYKYIADYQKENYDRITLLAPKGMKKDIKAAAELKGMTLSAFVMSCVQAEIDRMKNN